MYKILDKKKKDFTIDDKDIPKTEEKEKKQMEIELSRGTKIKLRLVENDLPLKWLVSRLVEYGVSITAPTLSQILNNKYYKGNVMETALTMSEKILDKYESAMKLQNER